MGQEKKREEYKQCEVCNKQFGRRAKSGMRISQKAWQIRSHCSHACSLVTKRLLNKEKNYQKKCTQCKNVFSRKVIGKKFIGFELWERKRCCSLKCHKLERKHFEEENKEIKFWARVSVKDPSECWPWQGGSRTCRQKHMQKYGSYYDIDRGYTSAHQAAWRFVHGEIPKNLVIRHTCDYPPCCNPNHLLIGTVADNNKDRDVRRRAVVLTRDTGHSKAKLSGNQVKTLLSRYKNLPRYPSGKVKNGQLKALAHEFDISSTHILLLLKDSCAKQKWKDQMPGPGRGRG